MTDVTGRPGRTIHTDEPQPGGAYPPYQEAQYREAPYAQPTAPIPHDRDGDHRSSPMDEAVAKLSRGDNRVRLLIATAVMAGLAMVFSLVAMIAALTDRGEGLGEPVLVDGVTCLVGEPGEDGNAILYCQR